MQLWQHSLWAILLLFNGDALGKKLPSYITKCKTPNPDQEDCIIKAATSIRTYLAKGIPEMNIIPFEPFNVPKITLSQSTQGGTFTMVCTDVFITGLTNYKFNSFKILKYTPEEFQTFSNISFENVNLKTKYNFDGTILKIPIRGGGSLVGNFSDITGTVEISHKSTDIKGDKYYKIVNVKSKIFLPKSKKNSLKFDHLKQGNQAISEATDHFLNENVDSIIDELLEPVQNILNEIVANIAKKFYDEFPFNVLYDM